MGHQNSCRLRNLNAIVWPEVDLNTLSFALSTEPVVSLTIGMLSSSLLVILAGVCLVDRHLRRACLAFIAFALLMTLAWWRLQAPWLALAEALLGALLTSMALLHGLGKLRSERGLSDVDARRSWSLSPVRVAAALAWLALVGSAVWILLVDTELSASTDTVRRSLLPAGLAVAALGLWAFAHHRHPFRRLLAFNVLGSGVFLLLATLSGPSAEVQGLILVGLVVALSGTVLGILLLRRLHELDADSGVDL